LENKMNQKISHTEVELNRKGDNSSLGQLLADFVLEGANDWGAKNSIPAVDAAILNIGGIRNDISKGDILLRNIFEVMPFENQLVVHTSGNTSIEAIDSKNRRGVFYPLQTMNKQTIVDFEKVPFCLEAENTNDFYLLQRLASLLSTKTYALNSYQRRVLHLAAVFMNNFSNHLVYISEQICKENEVPFEILQPLLTETFTKLQNTLAYDAQTGPARRGDTQTIANHLALLAGYEREIYNIITIKHATKAI